MLKEEQVRCRNGQRGSFFCLLPLAGIFLLTLLALQLCFVFKSDSVRE
jgi:hypothetical protein